MDLPDLKYTPPAKDVADVDEIDEDAGNKMEGDIWDEMEEDGTGVEQVAKRYKTPMTSKSLLLM